MAPVLKRRKMRSTGSTSSMGIPPSAGKRKSSRPRSVWGFSAKSTRAEYSLKTS